MCRVAEFFVMRSLRAEALCVICQKATSAHLPLLRDLQETLIVPELSAVIHRIQYGGSRQAAGGCPNATLV